MSSFTIHFVVTLGEGIPGARVRPGRFFLVGRLPFQRQVSGLDWIPRLLSWKILKKRSSGPNGNEVEV